MDATVMVTAIGAVPATLGAVAAVLAAKRSGAGGKDVKRMKAMLEAHVLDHNIHYLEERRNGAIRKEGRAL